MLITVSELKKKEVIRVCDGKSLGCISDVCLDGCTGQLCSLRVVCDGGLFTFGGASLSVPWENVSCIGDDAVLVDLRPGECEIPKKRKCK